VFPILLIIIGLLQAAALAILWRTIGRQDEHFKSSERAWILAEFGWYEEGPAISASTTEVGGLAVAASEIKLKLICRNEGKSPAWIDGVRGRADIVAEVAASDDSERTDLTSFGALPALAAGMQQARILQFECPSQPKEGEFFSVYVTIDYRDIFGIKRKTTLGYSLDPSGEMIYRQDAYPQRNMNT
jgi:hypothetical protein